MLLSFLTIAIDRATDGELISQSITGDPNAGLQVFGTVAASMVSLTALVLSITAVVVQLAMGQFSPRSVRPFLQDRPSQFAIGIFVGTFVHAMLAMREVRSFTEGGSVPGLTVVVSFGLVLVCIVVLVAYVHHIGNTLKGDTIIRSIGDETRGLLDKLYPASLPCETPDDEVRAEAPGLVFRIDEDDLVSAAREADVMLEMTRGVGVFIPLGAALFLVSGDSSRLDQRRVRRAVLLGAERTMDQDGAFGVQTLVDIAERALTDSFNDQTTASQAVDRLHDILRQLATRSFPTGRFEDDEGKLRLIVPVYGWDDYVAVAFDSLLSAAKEAPSVMLRIRLALEDLRDVAPPERLPAIRSGSSQSGSLPSGSTAEVAPITLPVRQGERDPRIALLPSSWRSMTLQNRVTPFGELIADPSRGLVYGNRGCLHDDAGRIRRRYAGKRWIACRLTFKGWHREPLLQPGRFTELFFLDEATSFAAGHRPCALCRREDFVRFGETWGELHPGETGADAIDARLHAERLDPATRRQRHHRAPFDLPDGTFVRVDDGPHLVLGGELLRWTPSGYGAREPRPVRTLATVITPTSLVQVLRHDRRPAVPFLHPSALRAR